MSFEREPGLHPNRLTESLARVCRDHPLAEKWLIAPSLRIGQQWIQAVARCEQPVVNVRVKTLERLANELAETELERRGAELLDDLGALVFIDRALNRLGEGGLSYLKSLEPTSGLFQAILASINDLRLAEVDLETIPPGHFEVGGKGQDLRLLYREFRVLMQRHQLIDFADVSRIAIQRLKESPPPLPAGMRLLLPLDTRLRGLEKRFLEAFPAECLVTLEVDEPCKSDSPKDPLDTDLERLRWLLAPAEAPARLDGSRDESITIFQAVGETNEVREVLRLCLAEPTIALDQVELLHTDSSTYVPSIYETLLAQGFKGTEPGVDLPVTFAEGVPCRYSRPGRALLGWIAWIQAGYPQAAFTDLIRDGLIVIPERDDDDSEFARLADRFRSVKVGFGRERYVSKIEQFMDELLGPDSESSTRHESDAQSIEEVEPPTSIEALQRDLQKLRDLVEPMIEISPLPDASALSIISAAEGFLEKWARGVDKLDQEARTQLLKRVRSLKRWLEIDGDPVSLNAWSWLGCLPEETPVLGSGPRPGCLHVDHVKAGGHSGRTHTFVVGLDDARYPGVGGQDPLLLDSERPHLSKELATSAGRLEERRVGFARLLARLRGRVTLSFPSHDLSDDRELFPSPVVLSAFRLVSGQSVGNLSELKKWLPSPASFAPRNQDPCLNLTEWWVQQLCEDDISVNRQGLLDTHFPHLGQGLRAGTARESSEFTSYDGRVEQAGSDLDPTAANGPVMSTHRFETLGRCPLAYFFQYGLEIKPPEMIELIPGQWLSAIDYGRLLHEVLHEFAREKIERNECIEGRTDQPRLEAILDQCVEKYRDRFPPPSKNALQRQNDELKRAINIFLVEEEQLRHEQQNRPAFAEARLGMAADQRELDNRGTALDTTEPVQVTLSDGTTFRACGQVDRIDRVGAESSEAFAIWDYKSGSSWGYEQKDPFHQGRRVQHFVYLAMVAERLKATVSPQATVDHFGFFFPGTKVRGERLHWSRDELAEGHTILAQLLGVARSGVFLPTNKEDDCALCEYKAVCGNTAAVAKASQLKLDELGNRSLLPFRTLRAPRPRNASSAIPDSEDADTQGGPDP
jgi:RecB family exonuclease